MPFAAGPWAQIYAALYRHAIAARGTLILYPDTDDEVRWPRTTGADAAALVAFFDGFFRTLHTHAGVWRQWHACVDAVVHELLHAAPQHTFAGNRALWDCLARSAVLLDANQIPAPPAAPVAALFGVFDQHRNVGPSGTPPFAPTGVATFDDLWVAQFKHFRELRGVDRTPQQKNIPRTTNREVITLADYWSQQLAKVKVISGRRTVAARWQTTREQVDRVARPGAPDATYPYNIDFWSTLQNLAVHVAVADEAPTQWDLALEALHDSAIQLPSTITHAATTVASGVSAGVSAVANKIGTGIYATIKTPLLIGGGVLGLFLLARSSSQKEQGT